MIQRIQTLYLLGALALSVLLFFVPFIRQGELAITLSDAFRTVPGVQKDAVLYASIMNIAVVFLTVVTIFSFKNTKQQSRTGRVALLLILALMAVMFLLEYFVQQKYSVKTEYDPGVYFPIASVLLVYLALKAIRKDYDLLQSANRIR